MQLHPCAISSVERNYDIDNKELLAIKEAFYELKHWKDLTDHKNLEFIPYANILSSGQACCLSSFPGIVLSSCIDLGQGMVMLSEHFQEGDSEYTILSQRTS